MANFFRDEFDVYVIRFSIGKVLKKVKWLKKCMQNITRKRNPNLRDKYMYKISFFRFK